jgi:Kef-type K+ transport system membrane component KefB
MHSTDLLIFFLALSCLFGMARIMGILGSRLGFPTVVGEILAGVVVGKTVLGRFWPDAYTWLFLNKTVNTMLLGYTSVAIVLLLAVAGLEIDAGSLRRRGKALAFTCVFSAVVPFVMGYGTGSVLPDEYLVSPAQRSFHSLFFGIALAISALPVITRTLIDLGLIRTQMGGLILSAAVANDLVGWICFSALTREMNKDSDSLGVLLSIAITTGFLVIVVALLRPVANSWLRASGRLLPHESMSRALSLILVFVLLGAAATEGLGIHAVFGGFVVGLAIGGSPHLRRETKEVLQASVMSMFTPVFFATMALRHDLLHSFDLQLVLIVVIVATISKVGGSALGAWIGGVTGWQTWAIGFGMNSRGAMEILLASVALDAGMINEKMFVALVIMAITTSVISGPAIRWLLRRSEGPAARAADLTAA